MSIVRTFCPQDDSVMQASRERGAGKAGASRERDAGKMVAGGRQERRVRRIKHKHCLGHSRDKKLARWGCGGSNPRASMSQT